LASIPQPRDRLENRRSTDDKMSREIWKEIENRKTDKARMEKARSKRKKRSKREAKREEREERKV